MKKILLSVFLLTFCCYNIQAQKQMKQDTSGVRIYFPQGSSVLEPSFRDNGTNLDAFIESLKQFQKDPSYRIEKIRIVSSASPEGNSALNKLLSEKRAEHIRSYFDRRITFERNTFFVESLGVDWRGLAKLVEASDMPYRTEMDAYLFPELRSSAVQVVCEIEYTAPKTEPETEVIPNLAVKPETEAETIAEVEKPAVTETESAADNRCDRKPFYMALKTNLLYDAALAPNVGAEFHLGSGWSLGGNWMYAWWKSDKRHDYWRIYGGELDIRKYFGTAARKKPLTGHHLGLYAQMLTYDFELGGTGILSKLSYGVGLEYGYSLPVGRRLNLDFGIGVGYLGGEYKKYIPEDNCYVWQSTNRRHWLGPTKAEISLVWLIGRGNYNENKRSK